MNDRPRLLAILAAAALLGLVFFFFWTRARASPAPSHARPTRSAEPAVEAEAPRAAPEAHAEARRARDAMRARIVEALRRRNAGPAPAGSPAPVTSPAAHRPDPTPDEDLPHGKYEPSYIQQNLHEGMLPILKQCYDAALERQPTLRGRLVLKFSIVGDPDVGGVVEDASIADESTLKDDEMETCARESLMALTFDKPPSGGGLVTVTYPIEFAPGDEEDAGAPEAGAPAR